jgi:hypothetical protein
MHDAGLGTISEADLASAKLYLDLIQNSNKTSIPVYPGFLKAMSTYSYPISWRASGGRVGVGNLILASDRFFKGPLAAHYYRFLGRVVDVQKNSAITVSHPKRRSAVVVRGSASPPLPHPFEVGQYVLVLPPALRRGRRKQ